MTKATLASVLRANARPLAIVAVVMAALFLFGAALFLRSREVMEEEIKMRLRTVAQVAAMQFDASELESIRGIEEIGSPALRRTVDRLRRLRDETDGLRFAYILRRTEDPGVLEFVADADSLSSDAELDSNVDGIVEEDEQASYPGDRYDVSDNPALLGPAFEAPTTDEDIVTDQWGPLMSGYAPIRDPLTNKVVAVLGVDMEATHYASQISSIFTPASLLTLFLGGGLVAVGFVLLSSRRKLEELERLNDERTRLLQLTFHQLGEPVTIFKWSTEALRDAKSDKEKLETIDQHLLDMDEGLARLSGIVDALAEAERVEKGTREYAARLVTLDIPADLRVRADAAVIADVLCKLLRNAADYSKPDAGITLRAAKRGSVAAFSVEDKGDGIAKKDLPFISDKYRRGEKAYLRKPDGKGLSLYTARGVIEAAGGRMWIRSIEGKGTSVLFTLPLA